LPSEVAHQDRGTTDLLDWCEHPSNARGMSFLGYDGDWRRHTYDELAEVTAGEPEAVIPIVLSTGADFVAMMFGTILAGCVPCPLAPPRLLQSHEKYVEHLAKVLSAASPTAVVTEPALTDVVNSAASQVGLDIALCYPHDAPWQGSITPRRAELALLQFTSGSTGTPRGVQVTRANLESNLAMIGGWVGLNSDDSVASWLPLYHDMGLIGVLLTSLVYGMDLRIMEPEMFIRDPFRWLECFGRFGATLTASPSFGFAYAAKHLSAEQLRGFDLSRWRVAIGGAERLDPGAISRFMHFASGAGFRSETFCPAFGMAEATLAITGVPVDETPRAFRLDWTSIRFGAPVDRLAETRVDDLDTIGSGDGWALDCGAPLAGTTCTVVGSNGESLPDGHVGEIVVSGPAVARGYRGDGLAGDTRFNESELATGDAGFMVDGRLFVLGRMADSLSLRGRNFHAEDLEAAVGAIDGLSRGRATVFTGIDAAGPAVVALVEAEAGTWVEAVGALLHRATRGEAIVHVLRGERGAIARTSSGKPRRRAMFLQFVDGTLPADVMWRSRR
jgi:acyl-CoA synthetase (AMP-forming)/AMP-acid ligase II